MKKSELVEKMNEAYKVENNMEHVLMTIMEYYNLSEVNTSMEFYNTDFRGNKVKWLSLFSLACNNFDYEDETKSLIKKKYILTSQEKT